MLSEVEPIRSYIHAKLLLLGPGQLFAVEEDRPVFDDRLLRAIAFDLLADALTGQHRSRDFIGAPREERRANEKPHLTRALAGCHIEDWSQFINLQEEKENLNNLSFSALIEDAPCLMTFIKFISQSAIDPNL